MKRKVCGLVLIALFLPVAVYAADFIGENGQLPIADGQLLSAHYPKEEIFIPAVNFTADFGTDIIENISLAGVDNPFIWNENGSITYKFNVAENGYYLLETKYLALPFSGGEILRQKVKLQFNVNNIEYTAGLFLYRVDGDIYTDSAGNEMLPRTAEYDKWVTGVFRDFKPDEIGGEPVYFYLEEGENYITVKGENVNIAFEYFTFKNYKLPPSYAEIKPADDKINLTPSLITFNETGSNTIFLQAEKLSYKTDAALRITHDGKTHNVIPASPSRRLYNTLGGNGAWSAAGQTAYREFLIPYDGYYRISIRARQNINKNASSYRRITLNGSVPCIEFNAVEFEYSPHWYTKNLTDENGDDIYIFLRAGRNTLAMEAISFNNNNFSPLELDYIEIATIHEQFIETQNNFNDKLIFNFIVFVNSYFTGYTEITPFKETSEGNIINIWADTDRETAVILREFINRDDVRISLVTGSVLEAALAGKAPDAALFINQKQITVLDERDLISEYGDDWVLIKNKNDFYSEQAARDFINWFYSQEVQTEFKREVLAAKGALPS